jgi:hypothetical protein
LPQNRGIDVTAKPKRSSDDVQRLDGCEMELARGSSHIASMLYEQSIHAAVSETLLQFKAGPRREDLQAFAYALPARLEQRSKPETVRLLRDFTKQGRLPELMAESQRYPCLAGSTLSPRAASNPVNDGWAATAEAV